MKKLLLVFALATTASCDAVTEKATEVVTESADSMAKQAGEDARAATVTTTVAAPASTASVPPEVDRVMVKWQNYPDGLQAEIDQMRWAKDCDGLAKQFNDALANTDAVKAEHGEGNRRLMNYINQQRDEAGCQFD